MLRAEALPRRISLLDFFERIFGDWAEKRILPYVNQEMGRCFRRNRSKSNRPVTREVFLKYLLAECVQQLLKHAKHQESPSALSILRAQLIGKNRRKAISACMAFGDNVMEDIIASWPSHILKFVEPGSTYCKDETIVAHYGKKAGDAGKLRHAPGKPYDFGLWIYVLAQQLQWTGIPILLGMQGNFLRHSLTPSEVAVALLRAIRDELKEPELQQLMTADSHWCAAATIAELQRHHIRFCISTKLDNGIVPNDLLTLAKSDLPLHKTRSYARLPLILQMTSSGADATGLISDAWKLPEPSDEDYPCTYATALALYKNESVGALVAWFQLEPHWASRSLAEVVHEITGWDVLRPENQQGSTDALTYAQASKLPKKALQVLYDKAIPSRKKGRGKSKKEMLSALFPPETLVHEEAAAVAAGNRAKKRTQDRVEALDSLREQVCVLDMITLWHLTSASLTRFVAKLRVRALCTLSSQSTAAWSIA